MSATKNWMIHLKMVESGTSGNIDFSMKMLSQMSGAISADLNHRHNDNTEPD